MTDGLLDRTKLSMVTVKGQVLKKSFSGGWMEYLSVTVIPCKAAAEAKMDFHMNPAASQGKIAVKDCEYLCVLTTTIIQIMSRLQTIVTIFIMHCNMGIESITKFL